MTAEELIAFELDIANEFNAAKIRAPIHLSGGNEQELIRIFKDHDRERDWVFSNWRSHYHAMLHGVPAEKVKAAIMAGKSISLCFPEHRFYSSAIVGGHIPIALGVAWTLKRRAKPGRVWAFFGDMAMRTGIAMECEKYALGHGLPMTFVAENNGKSVCTDTLRTWAVAPHERQPNGYYSDGYIYDLPWPHSGAGKRVEF